VPGKFVIKKGSTGKFRFSLVSTNGQIVATSEAYETKASAQAGIRSVKKLAADADVEDTTTPEWATADAARREVDKAKKAKKAASAKKAAAKARAAEKNAAAER
jgi:uncharacterized protein YegP (UPF0339 family)